MIKPSLVGVLLMLFSTIGFSQRSERNTKLDIDPNVIIGKLTNGFTYYLRKSPGDKTAVQFVVKAGYNQETADQRYLAHILEHMAFRGTKSFSNPMRYFEERGIARGSDFNAVTTNDRTVYYANLPAQNYELLEKLLEFYRECAHDINLSSDNVDNERLVVIEECRISEQDKDESAIVRRTIMGNTKYTDKPDFSESQSVATFKHESLLNYYNLWYRSNFQAIVIVGDIDCKRLEKLIRRLFSDLHKSKIKTVGVEVADTSFFGWKNRYVTITGNKNGNESINIYLKSIQNRITDSASLAFNLKKQLYNAMTTARLSILTQEFKYAEAVSSRFESLPVRGPQIEVLRTGFTFPSGKGLQALTEVLTQLERIKRYGFTATELGQAKLEVFEVQRINSRISNYQYAGKLTNHFVTGEIMPFAYSNQKIVETILRSIKVEDMHAYAAGWLTANNNMDIFYVSPATEPNKVINEFSVDRIFKDMALVNMQPYVSPVTDEQPPINRSLMTPQKANQLKPVANYIENFDKKTGITSIILENGMRIFLKPIDSTQDSSVTLKSVSSQSGNLLCDTTLALKKYAHYIIASSGIGHLKGSQLKAFFDEHNIDHLALYNGESGNGFESTFNNSRLEEILQLIFLFITEPKLDTATFESIISTEKAEIELSKKRLPDQFSDTIQYFRSERKNSSVRMLHELESSSIIEVNNYFKRQFSSTVGAAYAFSGNFNLAHFKALILKYLGNIPKKASDECRQRQVNLKAKQLAQPVVIRSGERDEARIQIFFDIVDEYSERNHIAFELIAKYLDVQLFDRLRRTENGIYNITVYKNINKTEHAQYSIGISFACAPTSVQRLINSVKEEILDLRNNGIEQDQFSRLKYLQTSDLKSQMRLGRYWANYIIKHYREQSPFTSFLDESDALGSINHIDVMLFANKVLSIANMSTYIQLPNNFEQ
ncbi:M16 family metallopeptidase [Parachryseolinea silvisoli]|uniref:M16 family metallopeptidase n=1 Tax=Parachryseolinea silvisoli TaxID=2873601 RepID=UPI002265BEBE|nr:insulinase family protein [Parachryseolinea silvisoli]MCD9014445.1 insulinase family protein [Parachryseolinea silvisoli]